MPWNQNTLEGWMAETILSALFTYFYFYVTPLLLSWFVAIVHYHQAFNKMFRLQKANIEAATNSNPLPIHRIKELFRDAIIFHASAKG